MRLESYLRRSRIASVLAKAPPSEIVSVPAPMGSLNTISSGAAMPPEDCLSRWNLIPAEYGLRTRLGSREYVTGLDGEVRSLIPFAGSQTSNDKLFAMTETGIWDVTDSTATPTQVMVFGSQSASSGHGVSVVFVTAAGHFLIYTDEANGAFLYTEGGSWAALSVTGVNASDLVHVTAWKARLWFTERNSAKAWYLPANAISGAATSYNVGAHFKKGGGYLVGLYPWTYDGGAGIDDSLVAISSAGDVVVYQGTDPAVSFAVKGSWFVGAVPAGRRIASDFGGELAIMTTSGIFLASELTAIPVDRTKYETSKIANLWNKAMLTRASVRGWQMVQHPQDATLIVIAPVAAGQASEQFVMSTITRGWSQYRGTSMGVCAATWSGSLYFGTADGKVKVMDGYVDGVTLADPSSYTPISWALLTGFTNLGTANKKRLHWVRTSFQSDSAPPTYAIEARVDWDIREVLSAPSASANTNATWDSAIWDAAVWGGDYGPTQGIRGLAGIGSRVALAIKGESTGRTVLTEFEVSYDEGGPL